MSGYLWKGRPIEDLTRDELLDALQVMFRIEERQRESNRQVLNAWERSRKARAA